MKYAIIKGALNNMWDYFTYQVNIDCLFTNTKRKFQKSLLKVRTHQALLSML